MSDSDFEVVDSVQTLQTASLKQQRNEASAATVRHQDEVSNKTRTLADANRNHQCIVHGLELNRVEDAALAARLLLEVEEAACFQAIVFRRGVVVGKNVRQRWLFVLMTPIVLFLLFVFVYEKVEHAATKEVVNTLQAAYDHEKALLYEVMVFHRGGKDVDEATLTRAKDICNLKMEVEKNMTADGLHHLGFMMTDDETVAINGTPYTNKECYIKALELGPDPKDSVTYHNLGALMSKAETVTINGTSYTKKGCFLKALEIDPEHKGAWSHLGSMMTPASEPVTVNGMAYTKEECLAKGQ